MSYFKITSESHFIEYKKLGNRWDYFNIEAKILPDRNFIADMLDDKGLFWEEIEEVEFNRIESTYQSIG